MKTFQNPPNSPPVGEFVYEGCRYSGIASGLTFSILSDGLANYLTKTFTWLVEAEATAPVADNQFCCSKCGRDCKSKYMKDRHEKACTAEPKGMAVILKPSFIFWNYKELDRTQLTPDQLLPDSLGRTQEQAIAFNEKDVTEPMPGEEGTAMIGKHVEKVVTDRDGIDWYGGGLEDDTPPTRTTQDFT